MTFKDIFPVLFRTLSFNFQDFPGPKWFSRTFQVLEFSRKKKSRTFQEVWEPWAKQFQSPRHSTDINIKHYYLVKAEHQKQQIATSLDMIQRREIDTKRGFQSW